MKPTNYSHSYEQQMSPDRAAVVMRKHIIETGEEYVQAAGLVAHPDLWLQPAAPTAAAESINFSGLAEQPRTATTLIERTGQEQQAAEARRRIMEETS